jgi:hypothetical protein
MARKTKSKGALVYFPSANPWVNDPQHVGEMTVRQLMGLVMTDEFPNGLDTVIRIGDVEGNLGVNGTIMVTEHKPCDVVLSIDPHGGDENYDPEKVSDE